MPAIDYLHPVIAEGLPRVRMPVVDATPESLRGYGFLFDDPEAVKIEIVRWPSVGKRPVDEDSGDEAGITSGIFSSEWRGDVLYGRNEAVDGHYILGFGTEPSRADANHSRSPERLLLWHANYHPDGGQLFFPVEKRPFLVPLALPTEEVHPSQFVCFRCDGQRGLYIHPNVWHEGVFATSGSQRFLDRQGAVHARVSVQFGPEFGCLLEAPLV